MGIFSSLLGGSGRSPNDGIWMKAERDCTWQFVERFTTKHNEEVLVEVGAESCFRDEDDDVFAIWRHFTPATGVIYFYAGVIYNDQTKNCLIVVCRAEKTDGSVLGADDWKFQGLSCAKLVTVARNQAAFNSYSAMPSYVVLLNQFMESQDH